MKKLLLITGIVLLAIILIAIGVLYWASTGRLSAAEYQQGFIHELPDVPAGEPDGRYTIITYNIGYCSGLTNNSGYNASEEQYEKNIQTILNSLGKIAPDFVGTQEIDFDSARSYHRDESRLLAEGLGLRYRADTPNWDKAYVPWPYWPPSAHFGGMYSGHSVASRFPIVSQTKVTLPMPEENPFWYNAYYLDRIIQIVEVKIGEQPLVILNVHLEAYKRPTREKQAVVVAETVKKYMDKPLILLGDFNARPPWKTKETTLATILAVEGLHKEFPKEAYESGNEAQYFTSSSGNPKSSIDHVFYNDKIRFVSARVLQDAGMGSDHLPVMMEFEIP